MVVCAQVPGVVEVNISGMETDAAVDFRAVLEAIKVTGLENAVNGSGLVNKSTSTSTVRVFASPAAPFFPLSFFDLFFGFFFFGRRLPINKETRGHSFAQISLVTSKLRTTMKKKWKNLLTSILSPIYL